MPATGAEPSAPPPPGGGGVVLRALPERFRVLVHELGKFGTVGSVAFTVDLAIFNVLLSTGSETLTAKTISTLFGTIVAFIGNRFWTWRHRERRNLAREYSLFFLFNAVGLGIGLACLAISHYGLGAIWPAFQSPLADNISGQLVGTGFGTLFRFWSYRRFVFRDTGATADLPLAPPPDPVSTPGPTGETSPPDPPGSVRRPRPTHRGSTGAASGDVT